MNQPPKFQPEKNKKFADDYKRNRVARPEPQPAEPVGNIGLMLFIVFAILLVIALFLFVAN